MQRLEHQVLAYINEQQLIKNGERLLIACSGGVDSMALLSFLHKFKQFLGVELIVAHVDHMLRGIVSNEDREFVEAFCQERGLAVVSCALPIAEIVAREKENLQAICRRERYQFFADMMVTHRIDKLVTAHHADDQLESMLMAITKAGSIKGIRAKRTFFAGMIIRPFLTVTKVEIREYLQKNGGTFREDASNAKEDYTRNRFRHRIVPLLKQENPNVSLHAVKLSQQLEQDELYLYELAKQRFSTLVAKKRTNSYVMEILAFQNEPLALQRRLILILLNYLYNDLNTIQSYALCTTVLKLFETLDGSVTINLPEDFIARRQYGTVLFEKQLPSIKLAQQLLTLNEWNDVNGLHVYLGELSRNTMQWSEKAIVYYFKAQSICFPLYVRARKDGDRIAVKGMQQQKKVSRIFIDEKIPLVERDRWPLLVDVKNEILAILAVRVNDKFSKTRSANDDFILVIDCSSL